MVASLREQGAYEIRGTPFGRIKDGVVETGRPSGSHGLEHTFDPETDTLRIILHEPPPGAFSDCQYFPEHIPIPPSTRIIEYVRLTGLKPADVGRLE